MASLNKEFENKVGGDLATKVQQGEVMIEKFARDTGAKIGAAATNLTDSTASLAKNTRDFVKEHPVQGVAIAAAAGMAAGALLTVALRPKH